MTRSIYVSPWTARKTYDVTIVPIVDALEIDRPVRFVAENAPCLRWFTNRAKLNGHELRYAHVDDQLMVIRVK